MSREQCLMESLEEAEQKGREAFRRGELIKPAPKSYDYRSNKDPLVSISK